MVRVLAETKADSVYLLGTRSIHVTPVHETFFFFYKKKISTTVNFIVNPS